ncbi:MAG: amino acid deaminase/aldolase [Nannocystis sp.]|nr:amino acid deaminase/aldolase [Nannocystis sp.]
MRYEEAVPRPLRSHAEYRERLRGEHLPLAFVDLELLLLNADSLVARAGSKPIRLASKSIRCRELLRRVLAHHPLFQGVLCFSAGEAAHLAAHDFRDLVVAYPTVDAHDIAAVCRQLARGAQICLMVDEPGQLPPLVAAAAEHQVEIAVAIDLDMSTRVGPIYFGVHRSPVHDVPAAIALADAIARSPGLRLDGLMGYEAQIAGLQDHAPGQQLRSLAVRALKLRSARELQARRGAVVRALRERGHQLRFVNGGGTGSLESTAADESVTELAAGSGLYGPLLFDGYATFAPLPAAGFALPVVRRPAPGIYTCFGGGWIASGAAGPDRLPRPYLPASARLLATEGAGEVQTPITCDEPLALGDPVLFRHAKAGELCEHVHELVLLTPNGHRERVPTYRGDGFAFV